MINFMIKTMNQFSDKFVSKLYVDKLYVDKLYVDKLYVELNDQFYYNSFVQIDRQLNNLLWNLLSSKLSDYFWIDIENYIAEDSNI